MGNGQWQRQRQPKRQRRWPKSGTPRTHSILVELQLQLHFALIMDKQEGVAAKAAGAVAGVCI